jgi:hypothetical protein
MTEPRTSDIVVSDNPAEHRYEARVVTQPREQWPEHDQRAQIGIAEWVV